MDGKAAAPAFRMATLKLFHCSALSVTAEARSMLNWIASCRSASHGYMDTTDTTRVPPDISKVIASLHFKMFLFQSKATNKLARNKLTVTNTTK